MMHLERARRLAPGIWWLLFCFSSSGPLGAATLVATYTFDNTFVALEAGVPALSEVNPLGTSGFVSDTVAGTSRRVYQFLGNASPASQQGGLTFDNSGSKIPNASYSVGLYFSFFDGDGQWRRILDVENRQSDNGFYVDTSNHLAVYPAAGTTLVWSNNVYHHVVLTNGAGQVKFYLDGSPQSSISTSLMNINNPSGLVHFFLDNTAGGGQGEYSTGRVALVKLYDGVLTDSEVWGESQTVGGVPEPGTMLLAAPALIVLFWRRHTRGRATG
jgi:hypothetical protein